MQKIFFPNDGHPEHFKALDGLRGLAILLVLLSHSSNFNLFFHEYLNFKQIGKAGVYLFFVLSAYLLDRQIALAYLSGNASCSYWKNYFLRRFLRIYPLFIFSLIAFGFLSYLGHDSVIMNWQDLPLHLLLIKGEGIFWSIAVEFKYYFLSPIIMYLCHKYLKWGNLAVLSFLGFLALLFVFLENRYHFDKISTMRYLPIFLVGTALSIFELFKKEFFNKIGSKAYNYLGVLGLAMIALTIPFYFNLAFGYKKVFHDSIYYLPYALVWGVILLSVKFGNGLIKKILELKLLRFLGVISFGLYLLHIPILEFALNYSGIPDPMRVYVFFALSVFAATFSYLVLERPFSRLRLHSEKANKVKLSPSF